MKTIEYTIKRKVVRFGGSLVVALPPLWLRAEGVERGDTLLIAFDSYQFLKVIPDNPKHSASLATGETAPLATRRASAARRRQTSQEVVCK
jgi:antitoxin component of MazEF toxin-antitoxin module